MVVEAGKIDFGLDFAMVRQYNQRWCEDNEEILLAIAAKNQEPVSMKLSLAVACFLTVVFLAGCGAAQSEKLDNYGSWMKRPPAEWPKIAVINQIDYDDKHHPVAGCGFLLEVGDEVLAATAKHVLTYFKSAKMDSVDFEGTLKSWKMFPKDRPSEAAC